VLNLHKLDPRGALGAPIHTCDLSPILLRSQKILPGSYSFVMSCEAVAAVNQAPTTGEENVLDMDATVARWCTERRRPVPADVEARTSLHIAAIEAFVAAL